jgi:integral membrane protein
MLKIFKITAILEGISFLVLIINMVLIKTNNPELYHTIVRPFGIGHGVLFIGYVLLAILLKNSQNWNFKTFSFILLASLIPFGTFYIEKKYLQNA